MNDQLAQIYGTGEPVAYDAEDLQKTAAAELLVKLAEEQGVDLNQFSDEEVAGMVTELYKEAQPPPFPPKKDEEKKDEEKKDEKKEEEKEKEAQEKFAEADFLGRVMAHAMVQELNNIDKTAAPQTPEPQPTEQEKEASALDQMAQQRAWEMAKEAGYVDEEGNLRVPETQEPEQEKTSALKEAVDFRALQMLEQAGLPVEWNKE